MATLATLVVKLVGDVGGFSSAMDEAGRNVQQFGRDIGQVGQDMTTRITAPIVGVGAAAVVMGNQFNGGMANVISLVPDAAEEIAGLSDDVQNLAVEMGQSTGDMTAGLYQVTSAFGYSAESMDMLRITAQAGAAGLATTADAINLVAAVTRGYGDTSAAAAQQTADLALRTVQLGQTTFPELAASIGMVTPLAANLGVTQQELFAVMATGAGVTGSVSQVSTQLRGVLQSMMAPTSAMTELMQGLGYANGEAMLQGLGLQGSIQAIVAAAEASGTPLQAYMGSIEGQTLALALAGPLAGDYASKLTEMGTAAGTAEQAFFAQTQGVNAAGFAMQQAAIQGQVLMQQLGNALGPVVLLVTGYVSQFVGWLTGLVGQFTALDPKTQMIILGVVGFVAALGPLLMILGPIVTGIGGVVTVVGALLSPIGLVVVAVALLAAAVVQHFGGVQATIQAVVTFVQGVLQGLSGFVQTNQGEITGWVSVAWTQIQSIVTNLVNGVRAVVTAVLGVVSGFISAHGEQIQAFVRAAWQQIGTIVSLALTLINTVVTAVLGGVAQFIGQHGAEIQAILSAAWNMISSIIQTALDLIEGVIRVALAIIQGDWSTAWEEVKTLVTNLWTDIQDVIEASIEYVIGLVTMLVNTVVEWFTNLYNDLVGGSIVPDMVNAIIEWFVRLRERAREIVIELRDRLVALFVDLKNQAVDKINQLKDSVLGVLGGLASGARERGAALVQAFADGVIGALHSAIDAARRLAQELRDLLPGSDARTGPLSDLTASGRGLPLTLAEGIRRATPEAVGAAEDLVANIADVLDSNVVTNAGIEWITSMASAIAGAMTTTTPDGGWDLFDHLRAFLERMQSLAAKIDAEGLGPARLLAQAAGEIGGNVEKAIEGITAAMTFELPKMDNTDALFLALRRFVAKLQTTAYLMQWKVFEDAVKLAEAAGKIGSQMKAAIEGIQAAAGFRVDRIADGTDLLFEALAAFVSKLQTTAAGMDSTAFDAAVALASAAGEIGKNIEDAITGIVLAMEFRLSRMADGTDLFVSQLAAFVQTLVEAGALFDGDGLKAAQALAEAAGAIGRSVTDAITGMTAAAKYAGLDLVAGAKLLADDAATLVRELASAGTQFDTAGLGAATAFASAAGSIGGQIEAGIGGLSALMKYMGGATLEAVRRLATDLALMVQGLAEAAGVFDQDALDAAQALASAAGEIGGSVANTVEGLKAIMAYAGGLTETAIDRFVADLHLMVVKLQGAALGFSAEGLGAAERLATVAGAIGEGVKSLAEAMKQIIAYVAPNPARIDEFAADMYTVIEKFRIVASVLGEDGIAAAERFARAGATIYQAIEDGIDSVLGIAGSGSMAGVGAAMQAMVDQVSTGMGAMATQFSAMVVDAHEFGRDWISAIMDGMTSRLGDLEDLLAYIRGLFPSSPARYGAWRDLPDGEGVGRGFAAALAGGVSEGATGVAGALAGLRGAFNGGMAAGGGRMALQPVTINQTINVGGSGEPAQVREAASLGVMEAARALGWA